MNIAITGNIGSGKSRVAALLVELAEAEHRDTDDICRKLLEHGQPGYNEVVSKWGQRFLDEGGEIDRAELRRTIFNETEIRRQLEAILHPLVREYLQSLFEQCTREGKMLVVEVPLLFETGWHNDFDYCVTVTAPLEEVVERVVKRDGVPADQIRKILAAQMDIAEKVKLSDWVIDNSGSFVKMHTQVVALYKNLKEKQEGDQDHVFPGKTLDS